MRYGGRKFDHVFRLGDIAQALRLDQQATRFTIHQRIHQDRAQRLATNSVQDFANLKPQKRLVLKCLNGPLGHGGEKCVDGSLRECEL
ncbi:hypothetical protein D3C76_1669930 [compost metagenome]